MSLTIYWASIGTYALNIILWGITFKSVSMTLCVLLFAGFVGFRLYLTDITDLCWSSDDTYCESNAFLLVSIIRLGLWYLSMNGVFWTQCYHLKIYGNQSNHQSTSLNLIRISTVVTVLSSFTGLALLLPDVIIRIPGNICLSMAAVKLLNISIAIIYCVNNVKILRGSSSSTRLSRRPFERKALVLTLLLGILSCGAMIASFIIYYMQIYNFTSSYASNVPSIVFTLTIYYASYLYPEQQETLIQAHALLWGFALLSMFGNIALTYRIVRLASTENDDMELVGKFDKGSTVIAKSTIQQQ